ncbi:scaffolding protein [Mycobacterium phage Gravaillia]|uniref:Scaffolding protein n=1 Tax=Mycobacterium phage Gancho TaxID=2301613 RepID=A0A385UEN8_9CAUD|nr:scaffolding protein [Mycobacterium phage Gancho]WAB10118.1 scaffolding protein [Mycobacterium phage Gravaillia]
MSGVAQYRKAGPRTFTPAATKFIRGGRVVEATTGGRIQEAAAGSVRTLGVALTDAIAPEDVVTTPTTDAHGRPVTALYGLPTTVAVADAGIEVKVTYAANANFGDRLVAAANGTVTPAGEDVDPRAIVGKCTEPKGVVVGTNAVGLMETA